MPTLRLQQSANIFRLSKKHPQPQAEVQRRAAFGAYRRRRSGKASYLPPDIGKTQSEDMIAKGTQPHLIDNNPVREVARRPEQRPDAIERCIKLGLDHVLPQSCSTSAIKAHNILVAAARCSFTRPPTHQCHICYRHQDRPAHYSSVMSVVSLSRN